MESHNHNGIENKQHNIVTKKEGSVENANRMLRHYFPKGADFATATQTDAVHALTPINNKPRKILGYKSLLQVAREKGLILDEMS